MPIMSNACTGVQLTPTQLLAISSVGGLTPCGDYETPFTGGDGLVHKIRYKGGHSGKFPGSCLLLHNNGEAYEALAIPQAAGLSPITYGADTVEVYSCRDFRGNSVSVSGYYIEATTLNPLWSFWWGDNRVQGNVLTNSNVSSTTGVLTIEPGQTASTSASRFFRNTIANTEILLSNDPTTGNDGIVAFGNNRFDSSQIFIAEGTTTWVSAVGTTIAGCQMSNGQITLQTFGEALFQGISGPVVSLSCTDASFNFSSMTGDQMQIGSTGTGAAGEYVTMTGSFNRCGVQADPPVGNYIDYNAMAIDGWASVVLDPNGGGHNNLRLDTICQNGSTSYRSNLSVEVAVGAISAGKLTLGATLKELYAGQIVITGASTVIGTPTVITAIESSGAAFPTGQVIELRAKAIGGTPRYILVGGVTSGASIPVDSVTGGAAALLTHPGYEQGSSMEMIRADSTADFWRETSRTILV